MTFRAYALTIAGCPYVFTDTPGLPSLTSSSALWPSPASVAEGYLVRPTNTWTERAKPLDGDLETDAQRFTLHDAKSGSTHLLTWLATRDPIHVTSTPLAVSMTAAAMSFTVGDDSVFSFPQVVWIEGEAILCASSAANVVTVTTRGVYGTKAAAHTLDATQGLEPEVFTTLPWITRRKVCLWAADSAGACSLLWAGYAVRAPVLSEDGARFDLPCDSLWTVQKQCPVGGQLGATRIVGYGRAGMAGGFGGPDSLLMTSWSLTIGGTVYPVQVSSAGPFRDWGALARDAETQAGTRTAARGGRVDLHIARSGRTATFDAEAFAATVSIFNLCVFFGGRPTDRVTSTARISGHQSASVSVAEVPQVLYLCNAEATATLLVSGLAGLPSSWTPTSTTDGTITTQLTPSLRCQYSEDWTLLLTDVSTADTGTQGARVEGIAVLQPRKPGLGVSDALFTMRDPPPLQAVYRVRTGHWAWGLRRAVLGLCEDTLASDWDWSSIDALTNITAGLRTARDWIFDGRRTLGSVVTECCLLHGCSPVMRDGLLSLKAWAWPDATTTPAVTLTTTDIIGKPTWLKWQEGLANRLQIKSPELSVDVSQVTSRGRYGPGRQITIELAGLDEQVSPIDDPLDFARSVQGRIELWSEPLAVVRCTVAGSYLSTLQLGDELTISEWMLPDGAGARGLSATRAVVIARTVDLGAATLSVDALIFLRTSYPYAPCARVSSQISTTVVECADVGYVDGTSSYSGGNDSATFTVGDKVDIIAREATSTVDAGQTISVIDTGTRRITFSSPMSAGIQARIAAGAIVDVRFAEYGTPVVAGQEDWMFVGDDTTRVIDGTATVARAIAP